MTGQRVLVAAGVLGLLCSSPGSATPKAERDSALSEVDSLLEEARREIRQFELGGGSKDDPGHPVAAWVERLWTFRERHRGEESAGKAAAEAIHLLVHAQRFEEVEARAGDLPPGDPAWSSLGRFLYEAAAIEEDYGFLVVKLTAVIDEQTDESLRGRLRYHLGRGQAQAGDDDAARASFKAAIREAAGTRIAKDAETALYKLDDLGYGQPAPDFASSARDGSPVALADYRDRVLLLVFWAST